MPIYEYECRKCHNEFEALIRGESDLENNQCPECGSRELSKLLSLFGMKTSGGGGGSHGGGGCGTCSGGHCSTCH